MLTALRCSAFGWDDRTLVVVVDMNDPEIEKVTARTKAFLTASEDTQNCLYEHVYWSAIDVYHAEWEWPEGDSDPDPKGAFDADMQKGFVALKEVPPTWGLVRTDCTHMHVGRNVTWSFYVKHEDVRRYTAPLPEKTREEK